MEQYLPAFKAYDIRGIYGKEIDEYFCYIMGYGLAGYLRNQYGDTATILISSDTRKINGPLIDKFITGLTYGGITHIDTETTFATDEYPYGIMSSSAAYYIGQNDWDMTVLFTASHNPAEYTGMKAFDRKASLTSTDLLRDIFTDAYNARGNKDIPEQKKYTQDVQKMKDKTKGYYNTLIEKRSQLQKNHKFVVDFSHGAGVTFEKNFYTEYANNHLITMINDYPDGTFPSHESDTSNPKNYEQLIATIKAEQAEFGVMFDGDGDRMGIISNTGEVIPGDIIYAIIAKQLLKNAKNNPILLYDCMSSKIVAETITNNGGQAKINKVGRFFINNEMQKVGALAGGEVSGHYMFGDIGCVESVLLAQYYIMKESENYNNFNDMVQEYKKYYKGPITSMAVNNKEKVMQTIAQKFASYNPVTLDGVSVYTDTYRFNIRPSNTENKVRFTVEANDETIREDTLTNLKSIILSSEVGS